MGSLITHKEAARMTQAVGEEQPHERLTGNSKLDQLPPLQREKLIAWYQHLADLLLAQLKSGKETDEGETDEGEQGTKASKKARLVKKGSNK